MYRVTGNSDFHDVINDGFRISQTAGGANPKGEGLCYLIIWPNFPENCVKMKTNSAEGKGVCLQNLFMYMPNW